MSRLFLNFVTEKAENRDVTLFGSIQNAKIPAPTPQLIPDVTLLFLRMCEICVGSIIRRALAAASERPATRPSAWTAAGSRRTPFTRAFHRPMPPPPAGRPNAPQSEPPCAVTLSGPRSATSRPSSC